MNIDEVRLYYLVYTSAVPAAQGTRAVSNVQSCTEKKSASYAL